VDAEQLDKLLFGVILAGLAGIGVAILWFVAAKIGRRSARGAGILAGLSALVYLGVGVAGAAIQGERAKPAPAGETKAPEPVPETKEALPEPPKVDPAIEQAAKQLDEAVAKADWEAAATAHAALKALDAAHPGLAPAWTKIEAGRAAVVADATAGDDGTAGTGGEDTGGAEAGSDDGTTGAPEPAADDGGTSTGAPAVEPEPEPEAVKKKKKKKKKRRPPAADGGDAGADAGADGGAPPEPEPEPEPEPAPAEG